MADIRIARGEELENWMNTVNGDSDAFHRTTVLNMKSSGSFAPETLISIMMKVKDRLISGEMSFGGKNNWNRVSKYATRSATIIITDIPEVSQVFVLFESKQWDTQCGEVWSYDRPYCVEINL